MTAPVAGRSSLGRLLRPFDVNPAGGRIESFMGKENRFSPEVKERAVRLASRSLPSPRASIFEDLDDFLLAICVFNMDIRSFFDKQPDKGNFFKARRACKSGDYLP